jgi:hypothetical protein
MSNAKAYERAARALIVAILGVAGGALADAPPDYRLAGIVAVGQEHLLAVIEMPDGKQALFRTGDALGSGRIRDITPTDVRVEMNGQDLLLSLRGNPKLSAAVPVAEAPPEEETLVEVPSEDITTRNQPLFYDDTVRLLKTVAATEASPTGATAAAPGGENGAVPQPLAARLNELLGVPPGAQIVAVDESPVGTPQDVIDKIVPLLGTARPVRLRVTGAGDLQTIVISPVESEFPP